MKSDTSNSIKNLDFKKIFSEVENKLSEQSLKVYRDLKNVIDSAFDRGKFVRTLEIARIMMADNEPIDKIVKYTGLTVAQIENL